MMRARFFSALDMLHIPVQALIWSSVFVLPWMVRELPAHWLWILGTLVLQAGTVYYYYAAMYRSPGHVPVHWRATAKARDPQVRHCAICQSDKPPRAHHCVTCGRCVLVRDHHCVWTHNCVGLHNRDVFLGFILFATASMSAALAWDAALLMWAEALPTWLYLYACVHAGIVLTTVILVGNLSVFQVCMCRPYNLTTLDYYIMERSQRTHSWAGPLQQTGLEEDVFKTWH
jgi:palmitoyltransferase